MAERKGIGLVLAGGGAKGAFQVGAMKALAEFGILNNITAVSGASAGGLNCAMLLQNDNLDDSIAFMDKIWRDFTFEDFVGDYKEILEKILGNSILFRYLPTNVIKRGILSQSTLQKKIKENISMCNLLTHRVDCYITCYRNLGFKTIFNAIDFDDMIKIMANPSEPFFINDGHSYGTYTPVQIKNILLATAAIPVLFGAVSIAENKYNDGGTEALQNKKKLVGGESNVPYKVLLDKGYEKIIIIHFHESINFKREIQREFPNVKVIEITPDIKFTPFDTCNFKEEKISNWIENGFEITKRLLCETNLEPYLQHFWESQPKRFAWNKSTAIDDLRYLEYLLFEMRNKKNELILKNNTEIATLCKYINSFKSVDKILFSGITKCISFKTAMVMFNRLKKDYELFEYNRTDLKYIGNDNIYFYLKK